ncbi:MAG: hypothetical protein WC455_13615 [Dehalococcoidia bacterium]|jgi:hypothetical protein
MPKLSMAADFRGGYATDVPSEVMEENMLLKAENVYWQNGLVNRGGRSIYTTLSTSVSAVRGFIRAYQNDLWYDIAAIDTSTAVELWKSTGTTWAKYSTDGVTLQTGYNVEMDQLTEKIVAVNGYDRPYICHYSTVSTRFVMEYLDAYDARTIDYADWKAGAMTTATTEYVNYTSVAQSTASGDFPILLSTYLGSTLTTACGHYIASDYQFTKVVYSSAQLMSTHATAIYEYWTTAAGWTALTSLLEATPTWTTAAGDRTVQLPYLSDWEMVDSTAHSTLLDYKYVMRVSFPVAPTSAAYCQSVAVTDIHYLTRIMSDERPQLCKAHANHMFLFTDNNAQFSPIRSLKNWDEIDVEYFEEGGHKISGTASLTNNLLIVKPGALYGFFTNDWSNLTKTKLSGIGSQYGRSIAVVAQMAFFLAEDGVRLWNGTENILVSKHIKSDIDAWTKTGANGVEYKGQYWLAFPSTGYVLVADPDTFRRDDAGDGRISWFKLTGCRADQFNWHSGGSDDGYLLSVDNTSTAVAITRLENGSNTDGSTGVAFTKDVKTRYLVTPADVLNRRITPAFAGLGSWSLILSADHGASTVTTDVTVAIATTHSNRYLTTISIPYQFDGRAIAFELQTASTDAIKVYSLSYEQDRGYRRY